MDLDEAYDIIEGLQFSLSGEPLRARLQAHADALQPGEEGRAAFLGVLAEFLEMDGDLETARRVYEEAIADGGPTQLDPRGGLLDVELTSGRTDEAESLLTELTAMARADELNLMNYEFIGETLEHHERYREAMRWFTMPLRDIDPDAIDELPVGLMNGRFRVRRLLDLPMDRYDVASEKVREHFRARVGWDA